jgi:hypothetical protein
MSEIKSALLPDKSTPSWTSAPHGHIKPLILLSPQRL